MPDSISATAEWRPVPTHNGYFVNALGQILGPSGRIRQPRSDHGGHLYVDTHCETRPRRIFVHRAVLMAFDRMPNDGEQGRHLDGDPSNNRRDNLAWGTAKQNAADKVLHGTQTRGEQHPPTKLTADQVLEIRLDAVAGKSVRSIARRLGIADRTVGRILSGQHWNHAEGSPARTFRHENAEVTVILAGDVAHFKPRILSLSPLIRLDLDMGPDQAVKEIDRAIDTAIDDVMNDVQRAIKAAMDWVESEMVKQPS